MTLKLGILASTRGSDIPAIIEAIEHGDIDAEISIIISNKECGALDLAVANGLEHELILSKGRDREDFDKEVAAALDRTGTEIIMLIGYMRVLSPWFVQKYKDRIFNIHPSLLPAFAGGMDMNVHQAILDSGVKVTGCTLHIVTEVLDSGPIVMQACVPIEDEDNSDSLKAKVQHEEQRLLVKAIELYSKGKLRIEDGKVMIAK